MEPLLKRYTVKDVRNWLLHNSNIYGLSGRIISKCRAYAIINNPYVEDIDPVVSAIFEADEVAAYTAAFPDMLNGKRIWWFTTLWCNPKFRGKGYGMVVVGSLAELYGEGNYFDMDGAEETVSIFKYLGLKTTYIPQYEFGPGKIHRHSFKGKLAYAVQNLKLKYSSHKKDLLKEISKTDYSIEYFSYIDDEAYAFIVSKSQMDVFLREQQMLNWILAFPFLQESPLTNRVEKDCQFSSTVSKVRIIAEKIRKNGKLVGVCILKIGINSVDVKYLYYDKEQSDIVFLSVAEYLSRFHNPTFITRDLNLANYVRRYNLTSKYRESKVSFSYPDNFAFHEGLGSQAGDGDNFA